MYDFMLKVSDTVMHLFDDYMTRFYIFLFLGAAFAWMLAYCLITNCPLVYVIDKKDGTEVGYGLRGRTTDDWNEDEEYDEEDEER